MMDVKTKSAKIIRFSFIAFMWVCIRVSLQIIHLHTGNVKWLSLMKMTFTSFN